MIKIHKLKDGDIIKILPIISDDDKVTWSNPYSCTVIDGKADDRQKKLDMIGI